MDDSVNSIEQTGGKIAKLPLLAAVVALIGLGDAIYLTIHHYTGEKVPCSIVEGCEQVLTSKYATIGGILPIIQSIPSIAEIPLAAFGAAAYFIAFSLAILAAFGNRLMWKIFGIQVVLMAIFTAWLTYLQAYEIEAFCQFCLLSAATTLTLLIIALVSRFWRS
jgi:uncharacterized membrane protein